MAVSAARSIVWPLLSLISNFGAWPPTSTLGASDFFGSAFGASAFFVSVFGEAGRHTRMAVGVSALAAGALTYSLLRRFVF